MTIGEAHNVNIVLRALVSQVEQARGDGDFEVALLPMEVSAAASLADRASKALGAGLTGKQVREALS